MRSLVARVGGIPIFWDSVKRHFYCQTTKIILSRARSKSVHTMAKYIYRCDAGRRINDTSKS